MRDRLWVLRDLRTGERTGVGSYLTEQDAATALDVIRRSAARGRRIDLRERAPFLFVDEWNEEH